MLYLTSWNIDSRRAKEKADAGALIRVGRGIYIQAGADPSKTIKRHALRIAAHLFPTCDLVGPTAVTHSADGYRLVMAGPKKKSASVGPLDIHVVRRKKGLPECSAVTIDDGAGPFEVTVPPAGRVLVEAKLLSEEGFIDCDVASYMDLVIAASDLAEASKDIDRILQDISDTASALQREDVAASITDHFTGFHQGRKSRRTTVTEVGVQSISDLLSEYEVYWYGRKIGELEVGSRESQLRYSSDWLLPLSGCSHRCTHHLPPVIDSLLPARPEPKLDPITDVHRIGEYGRLLSNIDLARPGSMTQRVVDRIAGRLADYSRTSVGIFEGHADLDAVSKLSAGDIRRELLRGPYARMPGTQVKVPAYLSPEGRLEIATDQPFTHIIKLPGSGPHAAAGLLEWAGMSMAKAMGVDVAEFALVDLQEMRNCLVIERFDIPGPETQDVRAIVQEDVMSLMGDPSDRIQACNGNLELVGRLIKQQSTDPQADALSLFKRALASVLSVNTNMHMKKVSLLKVANTTLSGWQSVRLSPAYDCMASAGLPMASTAQILDIGGKDQSIGPGQFIDLAAELGISEQLAYSEMAAATARVFDWCEGLGNAMIDMAQRDFPEQVGALKMSLATAQMITHRFHNRAITDCEQYADHVASSNVQSCIA